MLPSDVSLHVCVRAYIHAKTLSTPPPPHHLPRVQRKLISVLFFSQEDKAQAQCPASFSSAEREFWGTETEGQVITKGLAVDLVVDFIWKSNSATAFGEVCHFYMCEGTDCVAVGRTYNIKLHVSFFRNLPQHKWGVVATSVLLNGKPVSGVLEDPKTGQSDFQCIRSRRRWSLVMCRDSWRKKRTWHINKF